MLREQEKKELLVLARASIGTYLNERRASHVEPKNVRLRLNGGAFVTLEKSGELRGCIGHLAANKPLFQVVQDMAIAAATQDPRFPAVTPGELVSLEIEISVLSDFRTVTDLKEIKAGSHGVIVTKGLRRGLLLPQVAVREGWDVSTFLGAACRKAGLEIDSWRKPGLTIEIFTAEVFSEKKNAG